MSQREAFELMLKEDRYDEVTHRVFADWLSEQGLDEEAEYHYSWTKEKQEAIDWIHDWEDKLGLDRGELMKIKPGEGDYGFYVGNRESERDEFLYEHRVQFFRELEIATGLEFSNEEDREPDIYFHCAC